MTLDFVSETAPARTVDGSGTPIIISSSGPPTYAPTPPVWDGTQIAPCFAPGEHAQQEAINQQLAERRLRRYRRKLARDGVLQAVRPAVGPPPLSSPRRQAELLAATRRRLRRKAGR